MAAFETDPLVEDEMREHDPGEEDRPDDSGVQMEDEDRGDADEEQHEVEEPRAVAAAAHAIRLAVGAGHRSGA